MSTKRDHTATLQGVLQGEGLNIPDGEIYAGGYHEKMPDACITMRETGGPSPDGTFGRKGSTIQHPTVQVRVRHRDKTKGKSDADDVWSIIDDMDVADYSSTEMAQSGPIGLGTDNDGRWEWSINVELFISE